MFTMIGLFFIILLSMILYMLYINEHAVIKNNRHHAKLEEYWDGKNRRKFARFKKALDVVYSASKKPYLKGNGRTIDISEGGMKLLLDEKHGTGTILNMKIATLSSSQFIEVEGKVVWCEEQQDKSKEIKRLFFHGIEFLAMKEPSGQHLGNLIRSISSQS